MTDMKNPFNTLCLIYKTLQLLFLHFFSDYLGLRFLVKLACPKMDGNLTFWEN